MKFTKIRIRSRISRFGSEFAENISKTIGAQGPIFDFSDGIWRPPSDVIETSKSVIVRTEIADVEVEDLDIEVSPQAVKINGRRARSGASDLKEIYHQAEIRYGRFERVFPLPTAVDMDQVTASYSNGFLEIRLGKPKTDQTYHIQITAE